MTTVLTIGGVLLAGAVGAVLRSLLARGNSWTQFPTGTFAANIVGSFLLGVLTARGGPALVIASTGFLGAITTFSTLMNETVERARDRRALAIGYLTLTVVVGTGAAAAGLQLG